MPNVSVKLPALTQKDKDDILFGIEQGFDFIAASFVRSAACVKEIKGLLKNTEPDTFPSYRRLRMRKEFRILMKLCTAAMALW